MNHMNENGRVVAYAVYNRWKGSDMTPDVNTVPIALFRDSHTAERYAKTINDGNGDAADFGVIRQDIFISDNIWED
jgi:hypothetical protein